MTAPLPDLAGLEQLLVAATPGPWIADSHEIYQQWPGLPGVNGEWIGETCRVKGDPLQSTSDSDAALLVALVNAAPALIAAIRERDTVIAAVRELAERCELATAEYDDLGAGRGKAADRERWRALGDQAASVSSQLRSALAVLPGIEQENDRV